MDVSTGLRLVAKAVTETRKDRFFSQWVVQLPFMSDETYISFEDYIARITGANIDTRPTSEIMAELDEIEKLFQPKEEE